MNIILKNEYNMKINKLRIKILVCSRNEIAKPDIKLDGDTFYKYKYLKSIVTSDVKFIQEIKCILQQTRYAYQRKKTYLLPGMYRYKNKKKICLRPMFVA